VPVEFKKILAIKLRSLGDSVLMTASLDALLRSFPAAEIHSLVPEAWAPLLEKNPVRAWSWPHGAIRRLGLALRLRRERFDAVVCFHASPSSARLARFIGSEVRSIHFHGHSDRNRFSTVEVPGKGVLKSIIERDLDAVRALGTLVPSGASPRIVLEDLEREQARQWFRERGLAEPLLVLALGASRPTKSWPVERFAQVARSWKGGVLAVTSPSERELLDRFLELVGRNPRIQGTCDLSIRKLAGVISRAAVLAGNDSGPRHVAVAVGIPTVTLFGPEHPFEWHPYPTDRHPRFFVEDLACRRDAAPGMPAWCRLQSCTVEKHRCMSEIDASVVLRECERVSQT
jgi:ADP-heptose:LPS heptosyltransferase